MNKRTILQQQRLTEYLNRYCIVHNSRKQLWLNFIFTNIVLVHAVTALISLSQRNYDCLFLTFKVTEVSNFAEICFHMQQISQVNRYYRGADKSLARPGRNQATFPHFMELGGSLPHSQVSTTCPYPSQINPFHCPSQFWQAQLVSVLVGLRTYQHPGIYNIFFSSIFNMMWGQK